MAGSVAGSMAGSVSSRKTTTIPRRRRVIPRVTPASHVSSARAGRDLGAGSGGEGAAGAAGAGRSDFQQVERSLKALKRESLRHFDIECKATTEIEFINSQVRAMRKAFGTLADVMLEEMDHLRNESAAQLQQWQVESGRRFMELSARIDRVELKGRIHGKDMKIVKQAAEETYDSLQTLKRDNQAIAADASKHGAQIKAVDDDAKGRMRSLEEGVDSAQGALRERLDGIEVKLASYAQSLEAQLADTLQVGECIVVAAQGRLQR